MILTVVAASLIAAACTRSDPAMVKQLAQLEAPEIRGSLPSAATIPELEREVARYQREVNSIFQSTRKLGRVYEMLALKYFNSHMYGPALRSFKEAANIYPTNPALAYMAGLCEAQLAKVEASPSQRRAMFEHAAAYYETALSLNGSYEEALFALAVVDIYELDRAAAAEPYLKKLVSLDPADVNALFLLARVYATQGRGPEAAALYDKIIAGKATASEKARAEENKRKVLEGAFGR